MATISIVGTSRRVVDAPGLTIDELAGNVASNDDRISIAHVKYVSVIDLKVSTKFPLCF